MTGEQLRRMDPIDAILLVHRAHPETGPAELAALCTEYGVPVTEAQTGLALRAGQWGAGPVIDPAVPERPSLDPVPEPVPVDAPEPPPAETLDLDLADMPEVHPEVRAPDLVLAAERTRTEVHARVPDEPAPEPIEDPFAFVPHRAHEEREAASRAPSSAAVPADLLARARVLDAEHRRTHDGRPASIRALKAGLRIGQPRAEQVRDALRTEA